MSSAQPAMSPSPASPDAVAPNSSAEQSQSVVLHEVEPLSDSNPRTQAGSVKSNPDLEETQSHPTAAPARTGPAQTAPGRTGTTLPGAIDLGTAEPPNLSGTGGGTTRRKPKADPRLGSRLGKFQILKLLGKGAMGSVYLAEDTVLGRQAAVKFLLSSTLDEDPQAAERFLTEARACARIQHSNVVGIYEAGTDDEGDPYMVMELVTGGSVDGLFKKYNGRLPHAEATRIIAEAAAGLRAAHGVGVLHRDIKPANLMLAADGTVKVADFGLAKAQGGQSMTATGAVVGTPFYMAPEQCRGERVDHRADVYSLGATYFRLLVGRPPFVAASSPEVMYKQCFDPLPDVSAEFTDVPTACWSIIARAMAKDRDARYADMSDMIADLQAHGLIGMGSPSSAGVAPLSGVRALPATGSTEFAASRLAPSAGSATPRPTAVSNPALSEAGTRVMTVLIDPSGPAASANRPAEPIAATGSFGSSKPLLAVAAAMAAAVLIIAVVVVLKVVGGPDKNGSATDGLAKDKLAKDKLAKDKLATDGSAKEATQPPTPTDAAVVGPADGEATPKPGKTTKNASPGELPESAMGQLVLESDGLRYTVVAPSAPPPSSTGSVSVTVYRFVAKPGQVLSVHATPDKLGGAPPTAVCRGPDGSAVTAKEPATGQPWLFALTQGGEHRLICRGGKPRLAMRLSGLPTELAPGQPTPLAGTVSAQTGARAYRVANGARSEAAPGRDTVPAPAHVTVTLEAVGERRPRLVRVDTLGVQHPATALVPGRSEFAEWVSNANEGEKSSTDAPAVASDSGLFLVLPPAGIDASVGDKPISFQLSVERTVLGRKLPDFDASLDVSAEQPVTLTRSGSVALLSVSAVPSQELKVSTNARRVELCDRNGRLLSSATAPAGERGRWEGRLDIGPTGTADDGSARQRWLRVRGWPTDSPNGSVNLRLEWVRPEGERLTNLARPPTPGAKAGWLWEGRLPAEQAALRFSLTLTGEELRSADKSAQPRLAVRLWPSAAAASAYLVGPDGKTLISRNDSERAGGLLLSPPLTAEGQYDIVVPRSDGWPAAGDAELKLDVCRLSGKPYREWSVAPTSGLPAKLGFDHPGQVRELLLQQPANGRVRLWELTADERLGLTVTTADAPDHPLRPRAEPIAVDGRRLTTFLTDKPTGLRIRVYPLLGEAEFSSRTEYGLTVEALTDRAVEPLNWGGVWDSTSGPNGGLLPPGGSVVLRLKRDEPAVGRVARLAVASERDGLSLRLLRPDGNDAPELVALRPMAARDAVVWSAVVPVADAGDYRLIVANPTDQPRRVLASASTVLMTALPTGDAAPTELKLLRPTPEGTSWSETVAFAHAADVREFGLRVAAGQFLLVSAESASPVGIELLTAEGKELAATAAASPDATVINGQGWPKAGWARIRLRPLSPPALRSVADSAYPEARLRVWTSAVGIGKTLDSDGDRAEGALAPDAGAATAVVRVDLDARSAGSDVGAILFAAAGRDAVMTLLDTRTGTVLPASDDQSGLWALPERAGTYWLLISRRAGAVGKLAWRAALSTQAAPAELAEQAAFQPDSSDATRETAVLPPDALRFAFGQRRVWRVPVAAGDKLRLRVPAGLVVHSRPLGPEQPGRRWLGPSDAELTAGEDVLWELLLHAGLDAAEPPSQPLTVSRPRRESVEEWSFKLQLAAKPTELAIGPVVRAMPIPRKAADASAVLVLSAGRADGLLAARVVSLTGVSTGTPATPGTLTHGGELLVRMAGPLATADGAPQIIGQDSEGQLTVWSWSTMEGRWSVGRRQPLTGLLLDVSPPGSPDRPTATRLLIRQPDDSLRSVQLEPTPTGEFELRELARWPARAEGHLTAWSTSGRAGAALLWNRGPTGKADPQLQLWADAAGTAAIVGLPAEAATMIDWAFGRWRLGQAAPDLLMAADGTAKLTIFRHTRGGEAGRPAPPAGRFELLGFAENTKQPTAKWARLAIHPSGRLVAAASRGVPFTFWRLSGDPTGTRGTLLPALQETDPTALAFPKFDVVGLAFDPSGRWLWSVETDPRSSTARLVVWQVSATRR